ncbi:Phenolic glucoside malonyltransferase 1 [Raphanus sativus]|uniref:Phenolic glucoside malonyltransferase 1-like n=1 Tax=Raphanus sativus TaxID=3726 RepID=A0A6J0LUN6_RAPSA|nr:phenolic glucoside malonyltransferase 1-like [Raphanus sativus]KAJ4902384.1 Phenolic glucoside malonyltransferase 1 [Raphanus sativus]
MVSSLNVIDVSQVTPSDSSESLTLPLTFFDLIWYKFHPVERVIFYRLTDATRTFFDSVIVPNLKSSLSSSLSHYLPLAGKLVWDSLDKTPNLVYSSNDAVSFTIAESKADFSLLTGNKPFPTTELYPLVPKLQTSDESASAVSFQVTLFPDQGFCVGVAAHHGVLDGKTATMFLKSWAHTCKLQQDQTVNPSSPQDLIPIYDRTVIKDPNDIETEVMSHWKSRLGNVKSLKILPSQEISPDIVRFTLDLTREDIQTLRERLKRESSPKELRLSTFVVTFSYALTCLIRARGGDPKRPVGYVFSVDCRSLLDPPIPSNYFGNCLTPSFNMKLTAETFMGEEGFLNAARMVSDSVEELDETVAFKIPEIYAAYSSLKPGAQLVSASGSTRFGVYGLDFGWGKPVRVAIVSIDQGEGVSMAEGRDGTGGAEIGFSLKKHEMEKLIDLLHEGLKS